MAQVRENNKEIPLFEEKGVKDEAYRHKILQLETELARLEAIAKAPPFPEIRKERPRGHAQGAYHENLTHFDKRIRRENESLERKAGELTERLNIQAQRLASNIESTFNNRFRWMLLSALALPSLLAVLFIAAFFILRNNMPLPYPAEPAQPAVYLTPGSIPQQRLSYIKRALQNQTKYHHLYLVNYIENLEGLYAAEIELESPPPSRWFLKSICAEIVDVFRRYAGGSEAEFQFVYMGRLFLKANLTGSPPRLRLQYFY